MAARAWRARRHSQQQQQLGRVPSYPTAAAAAGASRHKPAAAAEVYAPHMWSEGTAATVFKTCRQDTMLPAVAGAYNQAPAAEVGVVYSCSTSAASTWSAARSVPLAKAMAAAAAAAVSAAAAGVQEWLGGGLCAPCSCSTGTAMRCTMRTGQDADYSPVVSFLLILSFSQDVGGWVAEAVLLQRGGAPPHLEVYRQQGPCVLSVVYACALLPVPELRLLQAG
jgi:hypothetical protein